MTRHPKCPHCRHRFDHADGCNHNGMAHCYLYGTEPLGWDANLPERCGDCNAKWLQIHHGGCTWAICRTCDRQGLWCDLKGCGTPA